MHVPDRLLVMSKGRVIQEFRRGTATREDIMAASEGMTHATGGRHVMSAATPSVPAATAAEAPATGTGRLRLVNLILELRAFIALIVLIIVFSLLSDSYLTYDNLVTMTRHVAINALLAIGMLMVILTGGIDLSVGSIVGLAGIVAGVLLEGLTVGFLDVTLFPPVWAVVIIVLAVGAGVGAINGTIVTRFGVAPFIATLGMLYVARGVALLISNGETYPEPRRQPGARQHRLRVPGQRRDPDHPDRRSG